MRSRFLIAATIAAMQVSPTSAVERDATERARLAFHEQINLACPPAEGPRWLTSDAVYRYHLDSSRVLLVEGRTAIAAHLCALQKLAPVARVPNIHVFPTLEAEKVFVQYEMLPSDTTARRVTMLAIIEMNRDQIATFTLLNRSPESLLALQQSAGSEN